MSDSELSANVDVHLCTPNERQITRPPIGSSSPNEQKAASSLISRLQEFLPQLARSNVSLSSDAMLMDPLVEDDSDNEAVDAVIPSAADVKKMRGGEVSSDESCDDNEAQSPEDLGARDVSMKIALGVFDVKGDSSALEKKGIPTVTVDSIGDDSKESELSSLTLPGSLPPAKKARLIEEVDE